MNVYGNTNLGLVRRMNQDCYEIWCPDGNVFAMVCDGMGGARSGNVASGLASKTFLEVLQHADMSEPARSMNQALEKANEVVLRRSQVDPECTGMGTTLVAVWMTSDRKAYVMNVGDSRAYLIREDGISKITRDHSLVADLVDSGRITPEQARTHPNKNIITRALGTERHTDGDLFELDLDPHDHILLCSDGLSNLLTDQELLYEVLYGGMDETCCRRLIELALERGAPDNVTAVLVCAGDEDDV